MKVFHLPGTRNRRRRGLTLTELVVVLGVIGVVFGTIWWAAAKARESQRQNDAVAELQTIAQNVSTLMAGRTFSKSAGTDITADLINAQAVPSSYLNSNDATKVDHPWRASSVTMAVRTTTTAQDSFSISFSKVSRGGCIALLTQGVNCQVGQTACPVKICAPTTSDCVTPSATVGWQTFGATAINTQCDKLSYANGTNAVMFFYTNQ